MRYREAMGNAIDVMTFLAYAATLGLLIGVLLGALALLLATPAHAGDLSGNLLLHRAAGEASPAPLLSTETTFRTDGPIERVRVVQAFRNPFPERQEALYVLRLPEEATLERLSVRVRNAAADDDEADEPAEPAAAAPGNALLSGTDSAGVVTHAIATVEAGEVVLVELEYQRIVRYDRTRSGLRLLTRSALAVPLARRRRTRRGQGEGAVPLGVEGAWIAAAPAEPGPSWLWLVPLVALYVLVAFFS